MYHLDFVIVWKSSECVKTFFELFFLIHTRNEDASPQAGQ